MCMANEASKVLTVWQMGLISKLLLPSLSFSSSFCSFMFSFLSYQSISIIVGGTTSPFPINIGIPQDAVLSPTLFLLFINALRSPTNDQCHLYADDSTLHSSTFQICSILICSNYVSAHHHNCHLKNSHLDKIFHWGRHDSTNNGHHSNTTF